MENNSIQAKKALFSLKPILHKYGTLPANILNKIIDTKILPILLYGSEIWGTSDTTDIIEKTHLLFCRYVLGVRKTAPKCAVRAEIGRFPLNVSCTINVVKFWLRLVNEIDPHRILAQCYLFQLINR